MEVHHHPHVERKNFKAYFLEFLMIFLAVTMGFFAETIRERLNEHKLAKEFASSMVKDLRTDTTQLDEFLKYINYAASNVDTLEQLVSVYDLKDIPSGKLYWYGLWGGAHNYFVPNDATFQQMKSSGTLRYFTSNRIQEAISGYDQLCRKYTTTIEMNRDIYTEVRRTRAQIFDFKYNNAANDIYQAHKSFPDREAIDSFINTNPPLLSYDKVLFNQYIEFVRSRFLHANAASADSMLSHATLLISELNKEYQLQNE